MIVADTNLVAYLLIEGERTAAAEAVYARDPVWLSPLLWRSEIRNVLAFHVHREHFSLEHAVALVDRAEELIGGRDYAVESSDVLRLAAESGCSAYDCEFVALARTLDLPLVTADRSLLRAFPGVAVGFEEWAQG